jgi:Arc/MetJ family transcription regulator
VTRITIDIDGDLVEAVMRRYGLSTEQEAVDLALRRLVGAPVNKDFLLSLEGMGWEDDLDETRNDRIEFPGPRHGYQLSVGTSRDQGAPVQPSRDGPGGDLDETREDKVELQR